MKGANFGGRERPDTKNRLFPPGGTPKFYKRGGMLDLGSHEEKAKDEATRSEWD